MYVMQNNNNTIGHWRLKLALVSTTNAIYATITAIDNNVGVCGGGLCWYGQISMTQIIYAFVLFIIIILATTHTHAHTHTHTHCTHTHTHTHQPIPTHKYNMNNNYIQLSIIGSPTSFSQGSFVVYAAADCVLAKMPEERHFLSHPGFQYAQGNQPLARHTQSIN